MASYALSIKQNFNGNELTAVLTTAEANGLSSIAAKYFIEAYTSIGSRITHVMSGDAAASQSLAVPLGNGFSAGIAYTVRSIAMTVDGAPIADQTVTASATYREAPGAIAISQNGMSSTSSTVTCTVSDLLNADQAGDPIDHFLVQVVVDQNIVDGQAITGFEKVDRVRPLAATQNVLDGVGGFGGVNFLTGDQVTVLVTPIATVGGAGAEVSGNTTLSAVPNEFGLTVTQDGSNGPSVPSFTFAAVDSNPIAGSAITGLKLTISQANVADQDIDLFTSGNWESTSVNTLDALTITHGVNNITLTAGNEITLTFVASNSQGPQTSAQTSFTYNNAAQTSQFTAQSQVTFTGLVSNANLVDAIVSRDIVNNNSITANLNNSANLAGQALTALYNDNGTTVSLTLAAVDPNNNNAVITDGNGAAQSFAVTAMDQLLTFDLNTNGGAKWNDVKLLLTATSAYDAGNNTSITEQSSTINLINALLTMSVTSVQPSSGDTTLTGTLSVDTPTNYTPTFSSGYAYLYLDRNNSSTNQQDNTVDLYALGNLDDLYVARVEITSLTNDQAAITFTGLPSHIDGHGLHIYVTATHSTSKIPAAHNIAAADSSANKRYKFGTPTLSYTAGQTTASITSNGNKLTTAVDLDLTANQQELRILYNDNANDDGTVTNNDGFNVKFTDEDNNNNRSAITIDIAGIEASAETLLCFTNMPNVLNNGTHLVGGQTNL